MSSASANDTLTFVPEPQPVERQASGNAWKILVVDDEADIHNITRLVLRFFTYKNRTLELLDAYSAAEAMELLDKHPDIALILLDVVMETPDAGLRMVQYLREERQMLLPRIILRTGQPGYAPEADVIQKFDINDYHTKTELTVNRLSTVITTGLRAYDLLTTIEGMRRDLEVTVAERTRELEASNQLKDQLFAIIAHDLRGPIGNLKAFTDLLTSAPGGRPSELFDDDFLGIMRDNANATLNLLDNLLYWARLQQQSLAQDVRAQDLMPILAEVVRLWQPVALRKELRLAVESPPMVVSRFDATMISLVIRNLVGNSLKFTSQGGSVTIRVVSLLDCWRVSVQDTGIGMDQKQLEELRSGVFIKSTNGTDNEHGSGLGLRLCADFVAAHGSRLVIDSQPGLGSSFSFELPKV